MKSMHKVKRAGLLSLFLVLMLSSSVLAASFTSYSVLFDWNNFSVTADPGMSLNFTGKQSESVVYNKFNGSETYPGPDIKADLSLWPTTSLVLNSGSYYVQSTTSDADMSAIAVSVSNGQGYVESYADSKRTGYFTVSGSGNVNVQIPYILRQQTFTSSGSDTVNGYPLAKLDFANLNSYEYLNSQGYLDVGQDSKYDLLKLAMHFSDGDSGIFIIEGLSYGVASSPAAPVPVPATIVLFVSGLAGIATYRKKVRA